MSLNFLGERREKEGGRKEEEKKRTKRRERKESCILEKKKKKEKAGGGAQAWRGGRDRVGGVGSGHFLPLPTSGRRRKEEEEAGRKRHGWRALAGAAWRITSWHGRQHLPPRQAAIDISYHGLRASPKCVCLHGWHCLFSLPSYPQPSLSCLPPLLSLSFSLPAHSFLHPSPTSSLLCVICLYLYLLTLPSSLCCVIYMCKYRVSTL